MGLELKRGLNFDSFTLIENIGSGSTAEVWLVQNENGENKAMKIYSPSNKLSEFDKKILKKEYDFAKNLSNRNILPLESYGEFRETPYIIMPLATSSLMSELHRRMNKYENQLPYFNEDQLVTILYEVSNALIYLKTKKIIHKDLKPDNILILLENDEERLVLMDFNISKSLKQKILSQTRSLSENTSGLTPAYAAPEFLQGKENQKSDVFSLGITLFELATGNVPSPISTYGPGEILINGGELTPFKIDSFSSGFHSLIRLCLNIDHENRPSAKQLNEWSDYYMNNNVWPSEVFDLEKKLMDKNNNDSIVDESILRNNLIDNYNLGKQTVHEAYNNTSFNDSNNLNYQDSNPYKVTSSDNNGFYTKIVKIFNSSYFKVLLVILSIIIIAFIFNNINNKRNIDYYTRQGDLFFYAGDMRMAIKIYNKAYTIKPTDFVERKISLAKKLEEKYKLIKRFEVNKKVARVIDKEYNLWGLIDNRGNEILYPSKTKITKFIDGRAEYETKNKKIGIIDFQGNESK